MSSKFNELRDLLIAMEEHPEYIRHLNHESVLRLIVQALLEGNVDQSTRDLVARALSLVA